MNFVYAFLLGGILCAIAQLIMVVAKLDSPLPVLFGCILTGGVLGIFGIVPMLEEVGQAGMIATAIDAGFGVEAAVIGAMNGDPTSLIVLLCTLSSVVIMGIIAGTIVSNRMVKKGEGR